MPRRRKIRADEAKPGMVRLVGAHERFGPEMRLRIYEVRTATGEQVSGWTTSKPELRPGVLLDFGAYGRAVYPADELIEVEDG